MCSGTHNSNLENGPADISVIPPRPHESAPPLHVANIPAQSQEVTEVEGKSSGLMVASLSDPNPSSRTKSSDFAGTKATLPPRNKKGLGSGEMQALWNERGAVAVRTESRRCCSAADAAAPPSPCQHSDPALVCLNYHKMGFSSRWSTGKNVQLKKPGPCRHKRRRLHVHAQPCSQSQTSPAVITRS